MNPRVQCVIVHHRSPDTVVDVVRGALDSNIAPERILVVDNSPEADPAPTLDSRVEILRVENRGYAAAANAGLRHLAAGGDPAEYTIVCSHEAEITPAALEALAAALTSDELIAAAGPTLYDRDSEHVWSTGGFISTVLHRAQHHRDPSGAVGAVVDRDWLDGAFVLYRTDALVREEFDERYFLYFEETDLHLRLRAARYRVVWVPAAISRQSSSGIPPYLLGRNTLIFHDAHFTAASGRMAVSYEILRGLVRKVLTGRGDWSATREILRGWRAAERERRVA